MPPEELLPNKVSAPPRKDGGNNAFNNMAGLDSESLSASRRMPPPPMDDDDDDDDERMKPSAKASAPLSFGKVRRAAAGRLAQLDALLHLRGSGPQQRLHAATCY